MSNDPRVEQIKAEQVLKARRLLARLAGMTTEAERVYFLAAELTIENREGFDRAVKCWDNAVAERLTGEEVR